MQFPNVQGANLEGQTYNLPADFEGGLNLALVAFQQGQQADVDTWLPIARQLALAYPDFRYYELPTIYRGNPLFRFWLDSVMRFGIPDRQARAATITLYLDKPGFREALELPSEDTIYALLIDRAGRVLWRADGRSTPERTARLTQLVEGNYL